MTFPTAEEIWSTLVCMAEAICEEIEKLRPEVILVMYKSGSAIWRAAETRWRMTRRLPLPPVVGANIGPSKYGVYEREGYEWDGLEFADWIDTGHLVAWAVRHEEWVKALHQRIAEQSGLEAPGSFLIIDDVLAEGRTTVIVKSLLWAIYPNADSVLVAGMDGYWRETLGEAWFRELNPSPMPSIHDIWAQTEFLTANHINTAYNSLWRNLLSGLANHRTDPFGWCPLAPTHPVPTHLSAYMPVDVWLQFPDFFEQLAFANPLVGLWVIFVGALMVSRIPTFSTKAIHLPAKFAMPAMALAALLIAALVHAPWQTLTIAAMAYIIAIPFAISHFRKLQKENADDEHMADLAMGAIVLDDLAATDKEDLI